MKKMLVATALLGSTLLASGAMAQSSPASNGNRSPANASEFITQLSPGAMLLSDLMDQDIIGADNKDIGEVEDVILDRKGKVVALVIEVDKGLGDRKVALPMTAFRIGPDAATTGSVQGSNQNSGNAVSRSDDLRIVLNMPLDQLKSAPEFDHDD